MKLVKRIKEWFIKMISKLGYLLAGSQAQRKPSYFRAIMFCYCSNLGITVPIGYAPNVDFSDNPTTSSKTPNSASLQSKYITIPDLRSSNNCVTTQGSITVDKSYDLYLHNVPAGSSFPRDNYVPTLTINHNSSNTTTISGFKIYFLAEKSNKFDSNIPWTFYCRIRNGITKKIYDNGSRIPVTITKASDLDTDSQYCYSINFDLTMTEEEVTSISPQCNGRWNFETNAADYTITNPTPISTYIPIIVELI